MITLVADSTPLSILEGIIEKVEIIDSEGRLLGRYEPANPEECKAIYERALKRVEKERKHRLVAPPELCRTTREVLEHLERLDKKAPPIVADSPSTSSEQCPTP